MDPFTLHPSHYYRHLLEVKGYECVYYKRPFGEDSIPFQNEMLKLVEPIFDNVDVDTFRSVDTVVTVVHIESKQIHSFGCIQNKALASAFIFAIIDGSTFEDCVSNDINTLKCVKCVVLDLIYDDDYYRSCLIACDGNYLITLRIAQDDCDAAHDVIFESMGFHSVNPEEYGVYAFEGDSLRAFSNFLDLGHDDYPEPTSPSDPANWPVPAAPPPLQLPPPASDEEPCSCSLLKKARKA